jgi:hypothetical protein
MLLPPGNLPTTAGPITIEPMYGKRAIGNRVRQQAKRMILETTFEMSFLDLTQLLMHQNLILAIVLAA